MMETARKYKPYPEYKTSKLKWLERIPKSWLDVRIKNVSSKIGSGKTPSGGAQVYKDSGVMLLRSQNVHFNELKLDDVVYIDDITDAEMSGTRIQAHDILLNITGASLGRCYYASHNIGPANVNQHVCIIRPVKKHIHYKMLHYLMVSGLIQEQIFSYENGSSREGLNFQQVANLSFSIPIDIKEQQAIASLLDRETARIDELIAKKEQLIALLEEKRTALISHVVTKGLNPDAKMKESGIEWLGEIPEHWNLKTAKQQCDIFVPQRNKPELNNNDGYAWITMDNIDGNIVNGSSKQLFVIDQDAEKAGYRVLMPGAVIASCIGNFGIAAVSTIPCIINQQLQAYIPKSINKWYLRYVIETSKEYYESVSTSTTIKYINQDKFGKLPVPEPPLNEQLDIINYLDITVDNVNKLIKMTDKSIEKLQEYRTALISAAVTGKIDVRNEVN